MQVLALDDNSMSWALKGLHIVRRDAHILQAQTLQCLEAKDIANNTGSQVGDRPLLEEVQIIGDICNVLVRTGNWYDLVGFCLVVLVCRQTIGPDHRPGGSRRFSGHGSRGFNRVYTLLWHDTERTKDICVFWFVIGLPI